MKLLQEKLQMLPCLRALDVAARHGEFALKLKTGLPQVREIVAIDRSSAVIREAREKCGEPGLDFRVMDAARLDFPDNDFDLVAVSNSLHHLPDIPAVLNEMYRVLRPGGVFIINEMFRNVHVPAQATHVALHHLEAEIDSLLGEFHAETYTQRELEGFFHKLDLRDRVIFEDLETDPALKSGLEAKAFKIAAKVEKTAHLPGYEERAANAKVVEALLRRNGIERGTQLVLMGTKP